MPGLGTCFRSEWDVLCIFSLADRPRAIFWMTVAALSRLQTIGKEIADGLRETLTVEDSELLVDRSDKRSPRSFESFCRGFCIRDIAALATLPAA